MLLECAGLFFISQDHMLVLRFIVNLLTNPAVQSVDIPQTLQESWPQHAIHFKTVLVLVRFHQLAGKGPRSSLRK